MLASSVQRVRPARFHAQEVTLAMAPAFSPGRTALLSRGAGGLLSVRHCRRPASADSTVLVRKTTTSTAARSRSS